MAKIKKEQIEIAPLKAEDRSRWNVLARSYKAFYETELPDKSYDKVWEYLLSDQKVFGLGAYLQGNLVGFTHFLFHGTIWMEKACYLQDLFVDETARGHGVARALIEQVAQIAREHDSTKLYWQTRYDNTTARALYDKIAHHNGFIRYDYPLN